jgi:uncharacterized protein (TIGR02246 family)
MTLDDPAASAILRRLEDERQVRNLLARLSHLADYGAIEDYLSLWAPDGVWEGSQDQARGYDELRARVVAYRERGIQGPGSGTRHLSATQYVDFPGPDEAAAHSYFVYVADVDTQPRPARVGRYADHLVRLDGVWRIARRRIVLSD